MESKAVFFFRGSFILEGFFESKFALSPIIMEVENHPKWKETNIGGTPFPLPWLWEEG